MKLDLFANRVSRVLFIGGVVRIEFGLLQPDEKGEITQDTQIGPDDVHFTVTLPLAGYSRSISELRKFTQDLQAKGILKQQDQPAGQEGGAAAQGDQGGPRQGGQGGPRQGGQGGPRQGGQGGPRQGGGPGGRQGGQGGPGGAARQHRQQANPERARRQRELTDLTRDNDEEPLV